MGNWLQLNWINYLYTGLSMSVWVLYLAVYAGVSANAPRYLDDVRVWTQIYIGLVLLWRFHPFKRVVFTDMDAQIAFSAGVLLIMTSKKWAELYTYIADNI